MVLFVSKKVANERLLKFLKKRNVELVDRSMISFKKIDFDCPRNDEYETIFFSSPRSVHYFLEQCKINDKAEVGCIGRSTQSTLKKFGITPDFVGQKSGDPLEVSKHFKAFTRDKRVLFPQSNRSHRSMQKQLNRENTINLIVYHTILTSFKLSKNPNVLVFTSPSNCEAFLQSNKISRNQKIIAWGTTTNQFLNVQGIKADHVLETSSFDELTKLLENQL